MELAIALSAFIGASLSQYAIEVRCRIASSRRTGIPYKPACDVSKRISCTKAFMSRHGDLVGPGFPNPMAGMAFYSAIFILAVFGAKQEVFWLSIPAVILSLYLAYVSYVKQKNFCLVCSGVYAVNILLLIAALP